MLQICLKVVMQNIQSTQAFRLFDLKLIFGLKSFPLQCYVFNKDYAQRKNPIKSIKKTKVHITEDLWNLRTLTLIKKHTTLSFNHSKNICHFISIPKNTLGYRKH